MSNPPLTQEMFLYLQEHYGYYVNCVEGGSCRIPPDVVQEFDKIYRHIEPRLVVNWWCNVCVGDALRAIFGAYRVMAGD